MVVEQIHDLFSGIAKWIDILGILILLYGFVRALIRFFKAETQKGDFTLKLPDLQAIRCEIGVYILLALDFLIASDIIHTILEISKEQLLELALMIVMRTGIGYFLSKEIKELQE